MARTVKDRPWWVQAEWWEPYHQRCAAVSRWGRRCDLPARPRLRRPDWYSRRVWPSGCFWAPVDERSPIAAPPRWFRDHRWTNVQRVAVRDLGRRAAAEYRATGQVDVDLPVGQHRHGARWDWT